MERRQIIDMASGIGGGLLLVLAIVLFAVVPQDEPVPPTFQVRYVPTETTVPIGQVEMFSEGNTGTSTIPFPVTIDSQYVYRISFNVTWTDDVATSLPDTFQFHINSPDGERLTQGIQSVANPDAQAVPADAATGTPPTTYVAQPAQVLVEKSIGAPPRDGPTPGVHLNEDLANARSRLLEDLRTFEPGIWELEVYLHEAGDCPAPATDAERAIQCTAATQNNPDEGNPLEVVSVTYTTYDIEVTEIIFQ